MKQSNLYRWVKASERLPNSGGDYVCKYIDGDEGTFKIKINTDGEIASLNNQVPNEYIYHTFQWLEEIEPVQVKTVEEIIKEFELDFDGYTNKTCVEKTELIKMLNDFANQFKGSVRVSEEQKNVYREQGWDAAYEFATTPIGKKFITKESYLDSFNNKKQ